MTRIIGQPGTGPGGATFQVDPFTAAPLQTAFVLSAVPAVSADVLVWVNGVLYELGVDYTVVGTALTWLNTLFTLGAPDVVIAYYQT
jgi:hypothetical protein